MPLLLALLGSALVGSATTIVVGSALDEVDETITHTSNNIANVGGTIALLGGLYILAKWKKVI